SHHSPMNRKNVIANARMQAFRPQENCTANKATTPPAIGVSATEKLLHPRSFVIITVLDSSNTRMIALCESDHERYFAYATALRTASGPVYQIGPYRRPSLIRSKPSWFSRGRIS